MYNTPTKKAKKITTEKTKQRASIYTAQKFPTEYNNKKRMNWASVAKVAIRIEDAKKCNLLEWRQTQLSIRNISEFLEIFFNRLLKSETLFLI